MDPDPMGHSVEGEWERVMGVLDECFEDLKKGCDRISVSIRLDYRKAPKGRVEGKMISMNKGP